MAWECCKGLRHVFIIASSLYKFSSICLNFFEIPRQDQTSTASKVVAQSARCSATRDFKLRRRQLIDRECPFLWLTQGSMLAAFAHTRPGSRQLHYSLSIPSFNYAEYVPASLLIATLTSRHLRRVLTGRQKTLLKRR
jgi:hypothetical protein